MPALKCSAGIQRKSGSGFQTLRRGKMPRPPFGAEPRNLADIGIRILVNPFVPWAADYGSASLIRPTLPTQEFTGTRSSRDRGEAKYQFHRWRKPVLPESGK